MAVPLLLAPILSTLASKGLNLIASAVMQKGQEAVEQKLGVKLTPDISDEQALKLKQLEFDNEESLRDWSLENRKLDIEENRVAQDAITKRWEADLHSDNKLSKNIRPGVLVYLLFVATLFALIDSIPVLGVTIKPIWVSLFADAMQMVLGAYFLARTVEKGVNVWQEHKTKREATA